MTRNRVFDRLQPTMPLGIRLARLSETMLWSLVLASGGWWAPCARGAGILRGLTAQDRSQPVVLSQTGEALSLRSPGHAGTAMSPGTIPAYLAFPLHGGERFPLGTPTVTTGPQPGEAAVGPLDLAPTTQEQLNADLLSSRGAIVNTPDRSYAIAFLPRYARALAHARSSAAIGTGGTSGTIGLSSILGLDAPPAKWTINGIPASKLSQWFQTGTKEISHLTSLGVEGMSKTFGVKVTPTSSGYHIAAAQELTPPASAHSTAGPLPVPAPEPGGWVVFVLILGAGGLRLRSGSVG